MEGNKAHASAESLRSLASDCQNAMDEFNAIKSEMDRVLDDVLTRWLDPVGMRFKARYDEGLKPIQEKMIPNLEKYQKYLTEQAITIEEFNESF